MSHELPDFSLERQDDELDWREVVDCSSNTLWDKCRSVLESTVIMPRQEIQLPLVLAYILTPSALSTRLPLCFLYGQSGSGKSLTGIFASKMYQETTIQESSTTASVRNELNNRKWVANPNDPEIKLEQNTILVWDDLRPSRINPISPDNIFGILKSGTSRQTSITKTALPGVNTAEFCTFGSKIISSIHPIWSTPGAEELQRRALIFKFEKTTSAKELVNIENVSIVELAIELKQRWFSPNVRAHYRTTKKKLSQIKTSFDNDFKIMCHDVLTTLIVISGLSVDSVIELFNDYQMNIRLPLLETSLTDELLDEFLAEKKREFTIRNQSFMQQGLPEFVEQTFRIHSAEVLRFFKDRLADGSIDLPRLDNTTIHAMMRRKKFKPVAGKNGLFWEME